MFVICRNGHLGFWWEGDMPIFIEEGGGIFPSRSECLEYLEKIHGKDKSIEIIMSIKKKKGSILSF